MHQDPVVVVVVALEAPMDHMVQLWAVQQHLVNTSVRAL